jgi:hypothetical protein
MKIKSAIIILFNLIFFGCEEDKQVNITDGHVYADLVAQYDKSTNSTSGKATLWEGSQTGKRIRFDDGAKQLFMDVQMDYNAVDNAYEKTLLGFRSPSVFKFVDVNSKSFTNSIDITPLNFPAGFDTIDSSQPLTITWNGVAVPIQSDESVTLRVEGVGVTQDTLGSSRVIFPVSYFSTLSNFIGKKVSVSLERSKDIPIPIALGNGSGRLKARYIARIDSVYFK